MKQAELIARLVLNAEMQPSDAMLRPEYFHAFETEWKFVADYHAQNGMYPNAATMQTQFPMFPWSEPAETAQWIADEVAQEFLEGQINKLLLEINDANVINPREAAKKALEEVAKLAIYTDVLTGETIDLIRNIGRRITESERRRSTDDRVASGIPFGFDLIDEVTSGTQAGEIEIIFARPGEGKSLFLLFSAWRAVMAGYKIAFVSPEMTEYESGVRLDSMMFGVSSFKLQSGRLRDDEWAAYISAAYDAPTLQDHQALLFYETAKLKRQFTTADLAAIVHREKPDLVCVDGIMLLEAMTKDKDPRKQLINLCKEIKNITTTTGVPFRLAHQANRESVVTAKRNKSIAITDILPELHNMAESGAVEQYANRAFSLKYQDGRMFCAIRKNRNGPKGRIISMAYDVDRSIITDQRVEDANAELTIGTAAHEPQQTTFVGADANDVPF